MTTTISHRSKPHGDNRTPSPTFTTSMCHQPRIRQPNNLFIKKETYSLICFTCGCDSLPVLLGV